MRRSRAVSPQTLVVLRRLLEEPAEWRYGYGLSRSTGLKSGTLYPILIRLADRRWLETRGTEPAPGGRPPRHLYRLTGEGTAAATRLTATGTARGWRRARSRLAPS
ncbi:MAG: PadR family transcriptional regulator [Actinoallomurus sp.]